MSDSILKQLISEICDLQSAVGLLEWDLCTYMPQGGAEHRASVISTLTKEIHRRMIDPRLGDAASATLSSKNKIERILSVKWLKLHNDAIRVPEKLDSDLAEASSLGYSAWEHATTFEQVQPYIDRLVKLNLEYAACFPEKKPYDVLIDCFDPELNQDYLDKQFAVLRPALKSLIQKAQIHKVEIPFETSSSATELLKLCKRITTYMGYDYQRGNLSLTEHPFMQSMNRNDVRIATYLKSDNPLDTLLGVIHEAGHAIYEQRSNSSEEQRLHRRQHEFSLDSSALHESQSLFYETMLGKSVEFWDTWLPELNKILSSPISSSSNVISMLHRHDPTNVIRLKSGDLDYGLHILLRYDIERALFVDQLPVSNMKDMFNELTKTYFGRYPSDDRREGVLQDVHWPSGLFGYFPSYLLGASFAAQLWASCKSTDPEIVLKFLGQHVHTHGGLMNFIQLTDTFGGYDPSYYIEHLKHVYEL